MEYIMQDFKKFTMKEFIEKDIAVRLKKENAKTFLKACDKEGLLWWLGFSDNNELGNIQRAISKGKEIAVKCGKMSHSIYWEDISYFKKAGTLVVDFEDVDLGETVPSSPYRIEIDCDGKTTTARMTINGKEVKSATARCNPADKFNFKVGAKVAFERLFAKPLKASDGELYVGDRVVCDWDAGNTLIHNSHGKIIHTMRECNIYCVEFDEDIRGHDCLGRGKNGHCWAVGRGKLHHE